MRVVCSPTILRAFNCSFEQMSMKMANQHHNANPTSAGAYTAENYTRKADHTPQTAQPESETYILALHTDAAHHQALTTLRNKYFPPKLNKLSAHIALFRALPGSQLPKIEKSIEDLVRQYHPFPITADKPFVLSHGVGIEARVPQAKTIFRVLKEQWEHFLSRQDHSFRAHYTIQNKVDDKEVVHKTLEEVQSVFGGSQGMVTGLALYLYNKGYWDMKHIYLFPGEGDQQNAVDMKELNKDHWPALPRAGSPR
ncbi:MAG: hypothetical protein Q9218_003626 [Villophora microphyllina]